MWELLDGAASEAEIALYLARESGLSREQARAEARALIGLLKEAEMVSSTR